VGGRKHESTTTEYPSIILLYHGDPLGGPGFIGNGESLRFRRRNVASLVSLLIKHEPEKNTITPKNHISYGLVNSEKTVIIGLTVGL